jgi:peptide/nickel transport system permease protein
MPLLVFIVRRLVLALLVLLAVSFGTFVFFAGKFDSVCGPRRHTLAATLPFYWRWLRGLPSGRSLRASECGWPPLWPNLLPSLGRTGVLLGVTFVLVLSLALLLGLLAAHAAGSPLDLVLRGFSYLAWATPAFLLALCLQWLFTWLHDVHGVHVFTLKGWPGICPEPTGYNPFAGDPSGQMPPIPCAPAPHGIRYAFAVLRSVALPAVALAVGFVGLHGRHLRSSLLVTLGAPYATTARAKGLRERRVVLRHALRASLATFTSALLLDLGAIFGGALAVDWVFQLHGVGTLFVHEVTAPFVDAFAVQLLLLVTATFVVLSSLLSELGVMWLDPRTRPR